MDNMHEVIVFMVWVSKQELDTQKVAQTRTMDHKPPALDMERGHEYTSTVKQTLVPQAAQ